MKFYRSKNGSVVLKPFDIPCECEVIEPNTTDAAGEKHVPVIAVDGNVVTVSVGEVEHPMLDAHYIVFIALETDKGYAVRDLKPGDKPVATFAVEDGEKVIAAYEYCNLHGLWKADA